MGIHYFTGVIRLKDLKRGLDPLNFRLERTNVNTCPPWSKTVNTKHHHYIFKDFLVSAPIDIRPQRTSRRRRTLSSSICSSSFEDQYMITGTVLGEGAYGQVFKCTHRITDIEYAVKIVDKRLGAPRIKVRMSTRDDREQMKYHVIINLIIQSNKTP